MKRPGCVFLRGDEMFTVNVVASCGVEKETHTPFNTKLWSSDFRRFFPLLFLYDSRCKWTPIPPYNRKTVLWFYLKGREWVELNVACSCFSSGFVLCPLTPPFVWPPVGSLLSPKPQSVRGPAIMAVGSLEGVAAHGNYDYFQKSIHFLLWVY